MASLTEGEHYVQPGIGGEIHRTPHISWENRHAFLKTVPRKYLDSPQYWLVVWKILFFPFHIRDVILPIDELILFKMVIAPPTRYIDNHH